MNLVSRVGSGCIVNISVLTATKLSRCFIICLSSLALRAQGAQHQLAALPPILPHSDSMSFRTRRLGTKAVFFFRFANSREIVQLGTASGGNGADSLAPPFPDSNILQRL